MAIYTPDPTNVNQPADSDLAYLQAGELRALKTYLAAQLAGLGGPVNPLAFKGRNLLVNGSMRHWQRGTSFVNHAGTYSADRWFGRRNGNIPGQTISRVAAPAGAPTRYALKWQRAAGDTSNSSMTLTHTVPTDVSEPLAGQQVTLSFYAVAGANFSVTGGAILAQLASGTGIDQHKDNFTGFTVLSNVAFNITSTLTRHTMSVIVPADATELGLLLAWTPEGTAGADDSITITAVQLELGGYATPFEIEDPATELLKCQRFFEKSYDPETAPGSVEFSVGVAGGIVLTPLDLYSSYTPLAYKVTKHRSPAVTFYNPANGVAGQAYSLTSGTTSGTPAARQFGRSGFAWYNGANNWTPGHGIITHWAADAEIY